MSLPKVKCDGCRKQLLEGRFSESALRKYKDSVAANQRNSRTPIKFPRCLACSPGNRQEMKCTYCNITKSLDDFSKQQRKSTETAECKNCVQAREDRVPNHEDAVEEELIMEELQRRGRSFTSNVSRSNVSRFTPQNSRLSGSQSESERYETETNPGSDSWARGNDAISYNGSDYSSGTIASRRPMTGTVWDNFEGDNRQRGPSSLASRERFVKQNAVPKPQEQKAREQLQRERFIQQHENEKLTSADSDEGSDDDDEDPY